MTSIISIGASNVILLHGLARTSKSMDGLESFLSEHNFSVVNIDYPSRHFKIPELAKRVRKNIINRTRNSESSKLHFVTHSMGGIILRQIQATHPLPNLGRVVMLGPPNKGSEVVDKLSKVKLFRLMNGPAAVQLSTSSESLPHSLGPVDFELGVIAGDRSINPILSTLIPGKDDGKVSVARTQVDGMKDFIVFHSPHPILMNNQEVRSSILSFLQKGNFVIKK
ncbi:alpha/beta hydrolase [Opitutales bacterium]|nr:alpha/beta hydrolase [Opitutales bacterium]MDA8991223.1 alpha/beta hydrolase [Opitutales bacterium]